MAEQAKCQYCGKAYSKRNLRPGAEGGAVCKDWFACQQRRDANRAKIRDGRFRQVS